MNEVSRIGVGVSVGGASPRVAVATQKASASVSEASRKGAKAQRLRVLDQDF